MLKLIKWFFNLILFLIVFGFVVSLFEKDTKNNTSSSQNITDSIETFTLKCKFNSGALYTDTLKFNNDNSKVFRTSDNRSFKSVSYNVRTLEDHLILSGLATTVDMNGNKTFIQDKDLWILTKNAPENSTSYKNEFWEWELYYFSEFESDPVRFLSCYEV